MIVKIILSTLLGIALLTLIISYICFYKVFYISNKNKKFNLKQMAKQSNNSSIANKFEKDFLELIKAFKNDLSNI